MIYLFIYCINTLKNNTVIKLIFFNIDTVTMTMQKVKLIIYFCYYYLTNIYKGVVIFY